MLTRVKRKLQRKETGDVFMLIDIVEGMLGAVKEYDGLIAVGISVFRFYQRRCQHG